MRRRLIPLLTVLISMAWAAESSGAEWVRLEVFTGAKAAPVVFTAEQSHVKKLANGYSIKGDLWVHTATGKLRILGVEGLFECDKADSNRLTRLRGRCFVPAPYVSDHIQIKDPVTAELGLDQGRNLKLEVPLDAETSYLFFRFDAGLEMEIGGAKGTKPLKLSVPPGIRATMVIDPNDPFYYIGGAIALGENKKSGAKKGEGTSKERETDIEYGFGRSVKGRIPFRPQYLEGLGDKVKGFSGHRLDRGVVPVFDLPMEIHGTVIKSVQGLDASGLGIDPLGIGVGPSMQAGGNGRLFVSFKFLKLARVGKIAELGFELGEATMGAQIVRDSQKAYFSGKLDPDTSWLPAFVPIKPRGKLLASGYVSIEPADGFLDAKGEYAVDASALGRLAGVELKDVLAVTGSMRADRHGFRLVGTSAGDLGPVGFEGRASSDVLISPYEARSHLEQRGMMRIGRMSMKGWMRLSGKGAFIGADLDSKEIQLDLSASLAPEKPGSKALVLAGQIATGGTLQSSLEGQILKAATQDRKRLDAAMAALDEAAKDYELELSLRGMRAAIPRICDAIVKQIDKQVPAQINQRWPRALGVEAPGKQLAIDDAKRQATPHRNRVIRLSQAVQAKDDDQARAALRAAIKDSIDNRRLTVRVALIGVVYDANLLSDDQVTSLRSAVAAIDQLPAKSDVKIKARKVVDSIQIDQTLDKLAKGIRAGDKNAIPRIERISFKLPVTANAAQIALAVSVVQGGKAVNLSVALVPGKLEELPVALGTALVETLR